MGKMTNAYKILIRKPEGKRSHGTVGHKQKITLKKYGMRVWSELIWFNVWSIGGFL
jgi:hypothetical protein